MCDKDETQSDEHTHTRSYSATSFIGVHVDLSASGMYLRFMGVSNVTLWSIETHEKR